MNSLVSVEDEEVICCESLENLVLSASNISGSSVGSGSDSKKSSNFGEESCEPENPHQPVDSLLVCLPERDSCAVSGHADEGQVGLDVISLEDGGSTDNGTDFKGFSVDIDCLPLLFGSEVISCNNDLFLTAYDADKLFNSDAESVDSFEGFQTLEGTNLAAAPEKNSNLLRPNHRRNSRRPNRPSRISDRGLQENKTPISQSTRVRPTLISDRTKPSPVPVELPSVKRSRGRPRKYPRSAEDSPELCTIKLEQNNSQGFNNPVYNTGSDKSEKATDGAIAKHKWESEEESLNDEMVSRHLAVKSDLRNSDGIPAPTMIRPQWKSDLHRSSSEESFEGFFFKPTDNKILNTIKLESSNLVDRDGNKENINKLRYRPVISSNQGTYLTDLADESDFIGNYCDTVGCTISWLESGEVMEDPVDINNGIVYELSEFAKKIAWEQNYIAIWILRLRGYDEENISDEDLKKIHLVLRRRKALSVNFAGKNLYKPKLNAFDTGGFSLPTAEKLENEKLTDSKEILSANIEEVSKVSIVGHCAKKLGLDLALQDEVILKENKNRSWKNNETKPTRPLDTGFKKNEHENFDVRANKNRMSPEKSKIYSITKEDSQDTLPIQELGTRDRVVKEQKTNTVGQPSRPVPYLIKTRRSSGKVSNIAHSLDEVAASIENKGKKGIVSVNTIEMSDIMDTDKKIASVNQLNLPELNTPDREYVNGDKFAVSSKGRIRKPTVKVQESYSKKLSITPLKETPPAPISQKPLARKLSREYSSSPKKDEALAKKICDSKSSYFIFPEDGSSIGKHCEAAGINVKLMNSCGKAVKPITNGVIYELYHFFKKYNAKLTALVHVVYRLKGLSIEKSPIIATMAKIHELVKVIWEEQVKLDARMPYREFDVTYQFSQPEFVETTSAGISKDTDENFDQPKIKRRKFDKSSEDRETKIRKDTNISSTTERQLQLKDGSSDNKILDLNATRGCSGKITRGDIVYLYTRWLKKKMEGQSKVFVTDLSKDVENLIIDREVGNIRIPVGTLMSSSVKLFEEFRRLSKVDMIEAKSYLLQDWITDIQEHMNSKYSRKSFTDTSVYSNDDKSSENRTSSVPTEKQLNKPLPDSDHERASKEPSAYLQEVGEETASVKMKLNKERKISNGDHPVGISETAVKGSPAKNNNNTAGVMNRSTNNVEEYEVEKIVGYRIVKIGDQSITEYRVRWSGFSPLEDSWVNVTDLKCPDILEEFWEALNKQRASKSKATTQINQSTDEDTCQQISKDSTPVPDNQENISPCFRQESETPQNFFQLMVDNLNTNLIDYQYWEDEFLPKRGKISRGDVLNIYDQWRQENQEKLLAGANRPVDVKVLISRVKELMDSKRVRNFNPSCLIDVCYRMSLMKAKLKDDKKVQEYLCGDFMEIQESSRKHQDAVREENVNKLKKYKFGKALTRADPQDNFDEKVNSLNKLERESLFIANYIKDNGKKEDFMENLEKEISSLKKILTIGRKPLERACTLRNPEMIKNKRTAAIQMLKTYGLRDKTVNELMKIVLRTT